LLSEKVKVIELVFERSKTMNPDGKFEFNSNFSTFDERVITFQGEYRK